MQGIGFTDEVDRGTVDQIVQTARARLAAIPPVDVTTGPAQHALDALARHQPHTAQVTVDAVALIDLHRDPQDVPMDTVAEAQMGSTGTPNTPADRGP